MFAKGRWKGAALMLLLWIAGATGALRFGTFEAADLSAWVFMSLSVMMLVTGLATYIGWDNMLRTPSGDMLGQGRPGFDAQRLTSQMGVLYVLVSFLWLLKLAFDGILGEMAMLAAALLIIYNVFTLFRIQKHRGPFGTKNP
ncbi:MAG: hypothetical protein FWG96_03590 [Methanomassiliicoccaceae archaeon]|nr:hypothetical protein [Methanomassiliicoccaceae archaeon]